MHLVQGKARRKRQGGGGDGDGGGGGGDNAIDEPLLRDGWLQEYFATLDGQGLSRLEGLAAMFVYNAQILRWDRCKSLSTLCVRQLPRIEQGAAAFCACHFAFARFEPMGHMVHKVLHMVCIA